MRLTLPSVPQTVNGEPVPPSGHSGKEQLQSPGDLFADILAYSSKIKKTLGKPEGLQPNSLQIGQPTKDSSNAPKLVTLAKLEDPVIHEAVPVQLGPDLTLKVPPKAGQSEAMDAVPESPPETGGIPNSGLLSKLGKNLGSTKDKLKPSSDSEIALATTSVYLTNPALIPVVPGVLVPIKHALADSRESGTGKAVSSVMVDLNAAQTLAGPTSLHSTAGPTRAANVRSVGITKGIDIQNGSVSSSKLQIVPASIAVSKKTLARVLYDTCTQPAEMLAAGSPASGTVRGANSTAPSPQFLRPSPTITESPTSPISLVPIAQRSDITALISTNTGVSAKAGSASLADNIGAKGTTKGIAAIPNKSPASDLKMGTTSPDNILGIHDSSAGINAGNTNGSQGDSHGDQKSQPHQQEAKPQSNQLVAAAAPEIKLVVQSPVREMKQSDQARMVDQVAKTIASFGGKVTGSTDKQVSIQLHPYEWGKLEVTVSVAPVPGSIAGQSQAITAHIVAESDSVKAAMEHRIGELKHHIDLEGIKLDSVTISVRPASETNTGGRSANDNAQSQGRFGDTGTQAQMSFANHQGKGADFGQSQQRRYSNASMVENQNLQLDGLDIRGVSTVSGPRVSGRLDMRA